MTDIRQSEEYAKYLGKLNWKTDECRIQNSECRIYVRKIPILGNFVKIHHPSVTLTNNELKESGKKHKAFSVQVTYSPSKTLILDLKPSLEKIFDSFSKDTRYEIRKAQEGKIIVQQSKNISAFAKMWTETALRRHFWIPFEKEIVSLYEAFGDKAFLLMAYRLPSTAIHQSPSPNHKSSILSEACCDAVNHKSPLAGALILMHDKTAHYFHAASTLEGRKLQAPSLVIWEAIKLAKEKGCTSFDFEGIFDPRDKDTKNWQGFTRFKKGFGGKEVEYPLTQTKFYFFNFQF
jgi:lipid II:glycine glycyltransferase (peptidoglycan interpeptide bridge formation enzyme)